MKLSISTLLLAFSLCWSTTLSAQLPNGSTAPDFVTTDIMGNTHHLYSYLDQGYTVILKFTATWCGPCWNYHNTNALQTAWTNWGPPGTDKLIVLFIESDANTPVSCLYGQCSNTQGNWVAGKDYPIIDDHTIRPSYNVSYYPTIYGICPTKKTTLIGQAQPPAINTFLNNCGIVSFQEEVNVVSCKDGSDGSIELDFDTGIPPFQVNWSNGMSGEFLQNIPSGSYSLTVTDANGIDFFFDEIFVPEPNDYVTGNITGMQPDNCFGGNGSISVQASGGNGGFSYSWSHGPTTSTVQNLSEGNYSVTISDQKNCTGTIEDIFIDKIPEPYAYATGDDLVNCYEPLALLDGSVSSSGPQYSYLWTTQGGNIVSGETTLNPVVDGGGTYTLAVTDTDFNCTAYSVHFVTIDTISAVVNAGQDFFMACNQSSVTLQGSGDTGPGFTFNWTTDDGNIVSGANTLSPTVSSPGTYMLTIFYEFNGCERSDEVTVLAAPGQNLSLSQQNLLCHGANTGSAAVQISGGVQPYTINWSNGASSASIQNLSAGSYTVTVSDAANCSSTASVTITQPAALTASVTSENVSEPGLSDGSIEVTPSGGIAVYTISWSNGSNSFVLNGLAAGTYSYTLTDGNGCTTSGNVQISASGCSITVQAETLENVSCFGAEDGLVQLISPNATGDLNVSWSDGGSGAERTDLVAGNYEVTVTDGNGCPGYLELTITQPDAIVTTDVQISGVPCGEGATGSIAVNVNGGTGDVSLDWSTGSTESEISGLETGNYSLTATDANQCEQVFNFTVGVIDDEPPVVNAHNSMSFELDSTGNLEINAAWLDNGSEDNCSITAFSLSRSSFTCDETGEHEVIFIVTDAGGNTSTAMITVIIEDKQAPTIVCPASIALNACDRIVSYDEILASDNCAIASIELLEGYASDQEFPLGQTMVRYQATDVHGNASECIFQVSLSSENITAGIIVQDVLCHGGSTGTARINILSGGSAPYIFEWSNGFDEANANDLVAGEYSVRVFDQTGCETTLQFSVEEPDPLVAEVSTVSPETDAQKGSISVNASGGVAPYSLELMCGDETFYFQGATTASLLDACLYDVYLVDDNGCVVLMDSIEVARITNTKDISLAGKIEVFPNPASTLIQMKLPENMNRNIQISIMDVHGKHVLQSDELSNGQHTIPMDISRLPEGLYMIRATDKEVYYLGRFTVIR